MSDGDQELESPLGSASDRAQVLADHPELSEVIADLERMITPKFHEADSEAAKAQRTIKRNQLFEISGSALVATLAIIGLARQDEWAWGAAAGVLAGLTAAFAVHGQRQDLTDWLDNRRIAEELRSLYFTTLTGSAELDSSDRRRALRSAIDRIIAPESERVREEIPRPASSDDRSVTGAAWEVYLSARLQSQMKWMDGKRKMLADRSRRFAWRLQVAAAIFVVGLSVGLIRASSLIAFLLLSTSRGY